MGSMKLYISTELIQQKKETKKKDTFCFLEIDYHERIIKTMTER